MASQGSCWDRKYQQNEQVVTRQIADETILVPIKGNIADMQKLFTLNTVGEHIWCRLDGDSNLGDIRKRLLVVFEVDPEVLDKDIKDFIDELLEAGLINEV